MSGGDAVSVVSKPKMCSIDLCKSPLLAMGWCSRHYARWKKYGNPMLLKDWQNKGKACSVDECTSPAKSRTMCIAHYKRWVRYGDPQIKRPTTPASDRFWSRVDKDGPLPGVYRNRGTCWLWTGGCISTGYGMFHPSKAEHALAHRFAYELAVGPIPAGLHIDHLCRNSRCVNPDHLEPVTPAENTRRGLSVATFNALKTHCPKGHPYDKSNTYVSKKGSRICRACARERDRQPHRKSSHRRAIANGRFA